MSVKANKKRYRFRLRFKIAQRGMLKFEEDDVKRLLFHRGDAPVTFQAVHDDNISVADTFEFSMSGFKSEEQAESEAFALRNSLLTVGAALGHGLGVSTSKTIGKEKPNLTTLFDCNDKPSDKPVQVVSGRSDILIIEQLDTDSDYINFEGGGEIVPDAVKPSGFFSACMQAEKEIRNLTPKQIMVLELFNAGYFETSIHARFLTWMLTIEAILELRPRPERVVELIDKLKAIISEEEQIFQKSAAITEEESKSLKGLKTTLKYAQDESINQGMSRLAAEVAGDMMFCGRTAEKFMKRCYAVRSALVHKGTVGKYKGEYGPLVESFEVLARLIVMSFIGIETIEILPKDMAGMNFNINLGFR